MSVGPVRKVVEVAGAEEVREGAAAGRKVGYAVGVGGGGGCVGAVWWWWWSSRSPSTSISSSPTTIPDPRMMKVPSRFDIAGGAVPPSLRSTTSASSLSIPYSVLCLFSSAQNSVCR